MVLVPRGRLATLMLTAPAVRARLDGSEVAVSVKLTDPVGTGVPATCAGSVSARAVGVGAGALGRVVPRLEAMVTLATPVPAWTTLTVTGADLGEAAKTPKPLYVAVNWWAPRPFIVKFALTLFFPPVRFLVPVDAGWI